MGYNRLQEQAGLRNSINLKCMITHLMKLLTIPPLSKWCQFCRKTFATQWGVSQHISASIICLKEWHKSIIRKNDSSSPKQKHITHPSPAWLVTFPTIPIQHIISMMLTTKPMWKTLTTVMTMTSEHPSDMLSHFWVLLVMHWGERKLALRFCREYNSRRGNPHGNRLQAGQSGSWQNGWWKMLDKDQPMIFCSFQ